MEEHFDNVVVMTILLTVVIFAFAAIGRAIGRKAGSNGMVTFFGGQA